MAESALIGKLRRTRNRRRAPLNQVVEETLYVLDVDEAFAVAGKVRKAACHGAASVR